MIINIVILISFKINTVNANKILRYACLNIVCIDNMNYLICPKIALLLLYIHVKSFKTIKSP